jgi:hypothetical protein
MCLPVCLDQPYPCLPVSAALLAADSTNCHAVTTTSVNNVYDMASIMAWKEE